MSDTYEEDQHQTWMAYLNEVYNQRLREKKMPILKDCNMIYDPLYDVYGVKSIIKSEVYEDPFWSSFDHAVRMANYHGMLSDKEYEFWLDFVEEEEYPTEDELNRFVNMCKEGINANNCEFLSLIGLIEDIEGYWPYA